MKKLLFAILGSFIVMSVNAQTLLDTALNFTVKDTYGNTLMLYDILDEGKIVVIDFFSTT
ncbi:MAG: peroxiredoxin family protein [Bacteroidales bacterium]|nr:peroxiredoxin family protein [Bacteroidales bacterium]